MVLKCVVLEGRPTPLSVKDERRREFHEPTSDCESWKAKVRVVMGDGLNDAALLLCSRAGSSLTGFALGLDCSPAIPRLFSSRVIWRADCSFPIRRFRDVSRWSERRRMISGGDETWCDGTAAENGRR